MRKRKVHLNMSTYELTVLRSAATMNKKALLTVETEKMVKVLATERKEKSDKMEPFCSK